MSPTATEAEGESYSRSLNTAITRLRSRCAVSHRPANGFEWLSLRPYGYTFPTEGWKVHVSVSARGATRLVPALIEGIVGAGVAVKAPLSLQGVLRINSGLAGHTQVGKVITAYPPDGHRLRQLIRVCNETVASDPAAAPAVPSDLRVKGTERVFIRYGTFWRATPQDFDPLGSPIDRLESGEADVRDRPRPDDERPDAPVEAEVSLLSAPDVLEVGGARFARIEPLSWQPKGRVDRILNLDTIETAILKAANPGVLGDVLGRDSSARLDNEGTTLTYLSEVGYSHSARVLWRGEDALATEDLGRSMLSSLPESSDEAEILGQVASALHGLHLHGVVHRDLKGENVIVKGGQVYLIDFELARRTGDVEPVASGTQGFIDPASIRSSRVTTESDVFAFGGLVFQTLTRTSPALLTRDPEDPDPLAEVLSELGLREAAVLVEACRHPSPASRPQWPAVLEMLNGLTLTPARVRRRALTTVDTAALADGTAALDARLSRGDSGEGWRNDHLHVDAELLGINAGRAGSILGLMDVDKQRFAGRCLSAASALARRSALHSAHGFFTGNAGIAVTLATAGAAYGRGDLSSRGAELMDEALERHKAVDSDLFSGSAGLIWAALCMVEVTGDALWGERVATTVHRLGGAAEEGLWPSSLAYDKRRTCFFGVAHGAAGIHGAIAAWAQVTSERSLETSSTDALRWLVEEILKTYSAGRVVAAADGRRRSAVMWCHGLSGLAWLLGLLGLSDTAEATGNQLGRCPTPLGNASFCHGMAGMLEGLRAARRAGCSGLRVAEERVLRDLWATSRTDGGRRFWSAEGPDSLGLDVMIGNTGPAGSALGHLEERPPKLSPQWFGWLAGR